MKILLFKIFIILFLIIFSQSCKNSTEPKLELYKIFFVSIIDINYDIYSVYSNGTNLKNLTNNSAHDWMPICSPYSNKIYFNSRRDNYQEIYYMNYDGSGVNNLTQNHLSNDAVCGITLNGSTLLFYSSRTDTGYYTLDINTKIATFTGLRAAFADISPDGTHLAYINNDEIHLYNIIEKNDIIISSFTSDIGFLQFSPDGSKLIFEDKRGLSSVPGNQEIWRINIDGSNLKALTNNAGMDAQAQFSADGTKITFINNTNPSTGPQYDIYTINADGTNQVKITDSDIYFCYPKFSPDGLMIACTTVNRELFIMNRDGSNLKKIAENLGDPRQYVFQPD